MSDPAFDVLADAVERAVHRYRHADAQQVDAVRAKAELIAVCDILSRQPAPDLDPVPAGVVEGALDAIRDHIAARPIPAPCPCPCHSDKNWIGGHTPNCWLRQRNRREDHV